MKTCPLLGWVVKPLIIVGWVVASAFVLFSAFFILITASTQEPLLPAFIEKNLNYSLFTALPPQGEVLGQSINSHDARVGILTDYLQAQRSPLWPWAEKFVEVADRYNLVPWAIEVAIAGKESGFGKVIPKNPDHPEQISFNFAGWGVFTGSQRGVNFESWEDAIEKIGAGLKEKYFDKGVNTPAEMEPSYCPVSFNRDHSWRNDIEYFLWEIENWGK